ncbi:MAG: hypothetical protein HYT41_02800 [Candidatus Sungbacteria bacterium]|nr:hypothetical protein [Candidatus Sungbacteria bacterium]
MGGALLASPVHAQFNSPVSLSSSPSSPAPRSAFTVTASTPTFDRETADFEWTVDGKTRPELSGLGLHQIQLTAGAVGSATRISVTVSPSIGEGGTATLTVNPSELTLLWSADTTVPKWYRGKALAVPGAGITVSAVPRIILGSTEVNPDTLIYRWRIDSARIALSGAGRRIFHFTASQTPGATHQIDLTVEDIDGRIHKEGRILIENSNTPKVALYQASPLGGPEFRSAGRFTANPSLVDIIAEPFFFPSSSAAGLIYSWSADGTETGASSQNPRLLTVNGNNLTNQGVSVNVVVTGTTPSYMSHTASFNLFITQ